ncbi:MAG: glycosyltransferase [Chitinivibrionales bacterium]|nr:glycosyltransferase [Chitinivibrionales bacterium]
MKLAFIAPSESPCPPKGYGGVERIVAIYVEELVKRGHKVDLYAAPGGECNTTRSFFCPKPHIVEGEKWLVNCLNAQKSNYDCIVDFGACHFASQNINLPNVAVFSGDVFKTYPHQGIRNRVYISKRFAKYCNSPNNPILYNPLDRNPANKYPLGDGNGDYALVVGIAKKSKGIHIAANAAYNAGIGLKIAGNIKDINYLKQWCNLPNIEHVGRIEDGEEKEKLYGDAIVLLHCPVLSDAYSLVPIEAQVCGTPVVATSSGGHVEFILPGVTGYISDNVEEISSLIWKAGMLDRELIRKLALEKVKVEPKVDILESLCKRAILGETW